MNVLRWVRKIEKIELINQLISSATKRLDDMCTGEVYPN
jgi:hypothetical protein